MGMTIDNLYLGHPIYIATKEWQQKRKHHKKRINKKWLKRYGTYELNLMPHNEVVMTDDGTIWMTKKTYNTIKKQMGWQEMGMTIDETVMHIMDGICENNTIKHSDLVVFDTEKQALRIAVDTMQKYQKIQEIYLKWNRNYDVPTSDAWSEMIRVIENGNDN